MSQDIISPEELNFLSANLNMKVRTSVGVIGEPASYNRPYHGISTNYDFKKPLLFVDRPWSSILIQSYVVDDKVAKTDVWGYPLNGSARESVLLKELSNEYTPLELTVKHESISKQVDKIHLDLHKTQFYLEGFSANEIPEKHYSKLINVNNSSPINLSGDLPF